MKEYFSLLLLIYVSVRLSFGQGCPSINTESICFINEDSWGDYQVPVVFTDSSAVTEISWSSADVESGGALIDFVDSNVVQPIIDLRSLQSNTWLIASYNYNNFDVLCWDSMLLEVKENQGACLNQDPFYPKNCLDTIQFGMLCNGNHDRFESMEWYPQVNIEPLVDQNGLNSRVRAWPKERTIYNLTAVDDEGCIHHEEHIVECLTNTDDNLSLQTNIAVYPNPVKGQFTVELFGDNLLKDVRLRIVDITGRTVKTINDVKTVNTIRTDDLGEGFYCIELRKNASVISQDKLVVLK